MAIAGSAFFRCAHTGEHVLFDEDVASVVLLLDPAQDSGEIDAAFAEFAEDAVAEGFEVKLIASEPPSDAPAATEKPPLPPPPPTELAKMPSERSPFVAMVP